MRASLGFVVLALIALTANAQSPTATSVYIYKYADAPGVHAHVWIDGGAKHYVKAGEVLIVQLAPGQHEFHAGDKQPSVMQLEAGKAYYFQFGGGFYGHPTRLTQVAPEQGAFDVAKLKRIDN